MIRFLLCFGCFLSGMTAFSQTDTLMAVNGTKLFVHIEGKGEPLLIIHGGPGLNHTYLQPWLQPLSKKYKLIYVDQRSSGQSALSVRDSMNPETFSRDMEALRQQLGFASWHVLTHSFGAYFGLQYATTYPDRVDGLILMNPVPLGLQFDQGMYQELQRRIPETDIQARQAILQSPAFQQGSLDGIEDLMRLSIKPMFCDTTLAAQFAIDLPANYQVASLSYQGFGEMRRVYDFYAMAATLNCALTIIHGACDVTPIDAVQGLNSGQQLVVLEKAGHYAYMEQQKQVLKTIRKAM